MVKSTKCCLKKVLKNACLSYHELTAILMEVEVVLNSRPLAYVEAEGIEEALIPSHLLLEDEFTHFQIQSSLQHQCLMQIL